MTYAERIKKLQEEHARLLSEAEPIREKTDPWTADERQNMVNIGTRTAEIEQEVEALRKPGEVAGVVERAERPSLPRTRTSVPATLPTLPIRGIRPRSPGETTRPR